MQSVSPNGAMRPSRGPRGSVARPRIRYVAGPDDARDPLDAVLDLGDRASRFVLLAMLAALVLHGGAIARAEFIPLEMMKWAHDVGADVHYRLAESYEIDLVKQPDPPPPPEEEPPPPKEEPKEAPPPPPTAVKEVVPAAAPAAAQAAAVLTAPANPDEPANFDGIISGTGETFAGGTTAANGTSTTAVRGRAAATGGVPGGTGVAATGSTNGPDKSRLAGVSGSTDWNCPFPQEADSEQIDQAFPTIQVGVRADGTPEKVTVLTDPGHGFGRAAVRCAMQQHYQTAMDHDGNPIPGLTKSIRVRFER